MDHNEEIIKNKLWSIALEDTHLDSSSEFLTTFNRSKNDSPKLNSFREISDWTNKCQLEEEHTNPSMEDTSKIEDQISRFSFLIANKNHTKYQSQLLPSPRKQKLELSPITMKFTAQSLSKNLKKQRERSRFSHQLSNQPSFYELNYRPLGLLY